jgi:hypoxanthine-guanine phosphoribosyltransferase
LQEILYLIVGEIRPVKCSMTVFKTAVYGVIVYISPLTRKVQTIENEESFDILSVTSFHAKNESSDCVYGHCNYSRII